MATFAQKNQRYIPAGAARALNAGIDAGKTVKLDHATASVVTLAKATGAGTKFRFVTTVVPSGSHIIKVRDGVDVMIGNLLATIAAGGAASGFRALAASDTITLNNTTTGANIAGDWIEAEDVAPGIWAICGVLNTSATPATPFSATVS